MNDREFAAALRDRDAILILSHLRPDGDTLGSGAALCSALRRMGKTAYLFPNPETTARYLPYVAQFFAPANFVPACVVAVDIATPNLFPQGFSGAVDLCIDHHPSNALYAGDTLLHAEKSACGEAVLDVIELLTGSVTEQEANLLYIAVTTDTGCFQYANTPPLCAWRRGCWSSAPITGRSAWTFSARSPARAWRSWGRSTPACAFSAAVRSPSRSSRAR